jgi:hypothetical protein
MNRSWIIRLGVALTVVVLSSCASAQASRALPSVGEIVRQIDDPHTGIRWLLARDASHPGGPGVLVPSNDERPSQTLSSSSTVASMAQAVPVIHAGDRLIVEETTALYDTRLEGVALGVARVGQQIAVRLVLSARVVRAQVFAPGRAILQAEAEVWR